MSVDFLLCSRDDQEWFSTEFKAWQDKRDPIFVLDLSSPILADLPLSADILRDYTLDVEIRVESYRPKGVPEGGCQGQILL